MTEFLESVIWHLCTVFGKFSFSFQVVCTPSFSLLDYIYTYVKLFKKSYPLYFMLHPFIYLWFSLDISSDMPGLLILSLIFFLYIYSAVKHIHSILNSCHIFHFRIFTWFFYFYNFSLCPNSLPLHLISFNHIYFLILYYFSPGLLQSCHFCIIIVLFQGKFLYLITSLSWFYTLSFCCTSLKTFLEKVNEM